jgi:hypothetical protein
LNHGRGGATHARDFKEVPSAHWLAATVLVARENLLEAERELAAGLASRMTNRPGARDSRPSGSIG